MQQPMQQPVAPYYPQQGYVPQVVPTYAQIPAQPYLQQVTPQVIQPVVNAYQQPNAQPQPRSYAAPALNPREKAFLNALLAEGPLGVTDLVRLTSTPQATVYTTLKKLQGGDVNTAHYYVQVVDYLNEMTKALMHITRPAFEHIDNNHEGLTREQTTDLIRVGDEVEAIYRRINAMLTTNDFGDIDLVLSMRDRLFETISDAIKSELRRFNTSGKGSTKASMLYLTILNETRTMVLQLRNLLKAQRHFLETKGVIKSWLYYAK